MKTRDNKKMGIEIKKELKDTFFELDFSVKRDTYDKEYWSVEIKLLPSKYTEFISYGKVGGGTSILNKKGEELKSNIESAFNRRGQKVYEFKY